MIPEFLGRLPIIFTLDGLTKNMLVQILKEPKNGVIVAHLHASTNVRNTATLNAAMHMHTFFICLFLSLTCRAN